MKQPNGGPKQRKILAPSAQKVQGKNLSGTNNGQSYFNAAPGFALVFAQSFNGGTDYAYNFDPQHNILGGNWILLT
jgi:hypothetical protein